MNALLERPETVVPTAADSELAAEATRTLAKTKSKEMRVRINDIELTLPTAAKELLYHLLTEMACGNAVTLIPVHAELTTQEAADVLNVSRPYLVKLLEEGKLPYQKIGTHRRVRFADLSAYKAQRDKESLEARRQLTAEAEDLGLGY